MVVTPANDGTAGKKLQTKIAEKFERPGAASTQPPRDASLVQIAQQTRLFVDVELRITDNIDEQYMADLELRIRFNFRSHGGLGKSIKNLPNVEAFYGPGACTRDARLSSARCG